jgi:hypothetical protein
MQEDTNLTDCSMHKEVEDEKENRATEQILRKRQLSRNINTMGDFIAGNDFVTYVEVSHYE